MADFEPKMHENFFEKICILDKYHYLCSAIYNVGASNRPPSQVVFLYSCITYKVMASVVYPRANWLMPSLSPNR